MARRKSCFKRCKLIIKLKLKKIPLQGDDCSLHEHQACSYAVVLTVMDLQNALQYSGQHNQKEKLCEKNWKKMLHTVKCHQLTKAELDLSPQC